MGFIGLEVIYLQKHLPGSNSGPRSNWKRNVTCKLWILSLSLMIPHYPGNSYCAYELFFFQNSQMDGLQINSCQSITE